MLSLLRKPELQIHDSMVMTEVRNDGTSMFSATRICGGGKD